MPENRAKGLAPLNRPITQHERDLIKWLLDHGESENQRLLPQVDSLRVVAQCTCGCPTVYFGADGVRFAGKGAKLISDYLAEVEGHGVGVMLFENSDRISSLEVYSLAGSDKPFGLPAIDSLFGWDDLQNHPLKP